MAHRPKEGQEVHDRKVAAEAQRLQSLGYSVQADLPGHPRPTSIGGHVPDIIAKKEGRTLIREIETYGTVAKDEAQHDAFEEYADQHSNANFRILTAKKK